MYKRQVDRSLVSKWKNGSRKIDTNAAYFDNAIDFLIERNKELEIEFLEKLFSSIYHIPNNSLGNTSSLITSIKKFIFDDINNYQQIIDNFINNGSIYSADVYKRQPKLYIQVVLLHLFQWHHA